MSSDFKCAALFEQLGEKLKGEGQIYCEKVGGVFEFDVESNGKRQSWIVDLKNSPGSIKAGNGPSDVKLSISDDDLVSLLTGKLNPIEAFTAGKVCFFTIQLKHLIINRKFLVKNKWKYELSNEIGSYHSRSKQTLEIF